MKNKMASTIGLLAVSAAAAALAFQSYGRIGDKLNLETDTQTTMQVKTVVSEDAQESSLEVVQEQQSTDMTTEETKTSEKTDSNEDQEQEKKQKVKDVSEVPESSDEPEQSEESQKTPDEEDVNPEAPVLTLKNAEVKLAVGDKIDLIPQVEDITDDKDSRRRLFYHIEIFGDYDTNTPGEYSLEYVVTDSDGNQSIPKTLKIIVGEE